MLSHHLITPPYQPTLSTHAINPPYQPTVSGLAIVQLFSDGDNLKKIGNKSGFLAGIMRRYSKEVIGAPSQSSGESIHKSGKEGSASSSSSSSVRCDGSSESKQSGARTKAEGVDLSRPETDVEEDESDSEEEGDGGGEGTGGGEGVSSTVLSRRERKKQEAAELQQLLEEVIS